MADPSTLGHALLGLLSAREMTGYELTAVFDESLANVWSARHSQIYPELAKLQAAGLIRRTESGARGSKRYAATEAGTQAVRRWLAETAPPESLRSERFLRVFFLWLLEPAAARAYLDEEATRHRERLARYLETAAQMPAGSPSYRWSRIALEAGIRFDRAMAEWAEWAAEQLREPTSR